jgi:hypothetical protein
MIRTGSQVTAVVVTYNSRAYIEKCLLSLENSTVSVEVIVVDNESRDGSADVVRRTFPKVRVIDSGSNRGCTGGNNIGIQAAIDAGSKYIFLLNPDARADADCIELMLEALRGDDGLAAVSPIILFDRDDCRRDEVWYAGASVDWRSGASPHLGYGERLSDVMSSGVGSTDRLCGCAMLVKATAFEAIGLFDERFFLYYEEAEWSIRCTAAGFRIGIVRNALSRHKTWSSSGGPTSSTYHYFMARNRQLFLSLHQPGSLLPHVRGAVASLRSARHAKTRFAVAAGLADFMVGKRGPR